MRGDSELHTFGGPRRVRKETGTSLRVTAGWSASGSSVPAEAEGACSGYHCCPWDPGSRPGSRAGCSRDTASWSFGSGSTRARVLGDERRRGRSHSASGVQRGTRGRVRLGGAVRAVSCGRRGDCNHQTGREPLVLGCGVAALCSLQVGRNSSFRRPRPPITKGRRWPCGFREKPRHSALLGVKEQKLVPSQIRSRGLERRATERRASSSTHGLPFPASLPAGEVPGLPVGVSSAPGVTP